MITRRNTGRFVREAMRHEAAVSSRVLRVAERETGNYALQRTTYEEDHPDYEGGAKLELWVDNGEVEYLEDLVNEEEFEARVADYCAPDDCHHCGGDGYTHDEPICPACDGSGEEQA